MDNTPTIDPPAAPAVAPVVPAPAPAAPAGPILGNWEAEIPAKFKADGKINVEALAKSYVHLEKMKPVRPPDTADGYVWKAPEGVEFDEATLKPFAEKAHKLGFSPEQFALTMDELAGSVDSLSATITADLMGTPETTVAALKAEWGDQYDTSIAQASKAWDKFGDGLEGFENHPGVIKLMAKLGAQLGADPGVNAPGTAGAASLDQLMSNPAYTNPFHAEHAQVKAQVDAAFARGLKPTWLKQA